MNEPTQRVALTFDAEHPDRPNARPDTLERILDALDRFDVRASFFLQGRWASAHPRDARRIAMDGHLIGNHSHYHARMTLLSHSGLREDVREAEERIMAVTGSDPRPWFRCPFGDGHDDPQVLSALDELGYRNVHWDVELYDWEPDRDPGDIARTAVAGCIARGDGAVVLLHTWPAQTGEALPTIIDALAGTRFVMVDELERLP